MADADLGPYGKSRGTRWGRLFAGLLFVAGATFVAAYYVPLYRAHQKLAEQYRELGQRAQTLSDAASKAQSELKAASEARDRLQAEQDARESAKKNSADQQEHARLALSSKLDKYLKKGNASLLANAGSLYVALDSALLFVPQKVDLTPAGRTLLCDVAKASEAKALTVRATLADAVVPAPLAATYPSAWALSAARAASVAQGLEQTCAFSAAQLSAVGNGAQPPRAGMKLTGDPIELEIGASSR